MVTMSLLTVLVVMLTLRVVPGTRRRVKFETTLHSESMCLWVFLDIKQCYKGRSLS